MRDVYEAGMPTARRRRRRALALGLLALLLLVAAAGAWRLLAHEDPASSPPTATSGTTCPDPPAGITVDVYNATSRAGLATLTADTLRAQRFDVGRATNAPEGTTLTAPAEIRHGKDAKPGAEVLAHRIRGSVLREIPRAGTRVDLVLGPDFGAVTAPAGAPGC